MTRGEWERRGTDTWPSLYPLSHLPQVTQTINKDTQGCREDQVSFRATKQRGGQKRTEEENNQRRVKLSQRALLKGQVGPRH